MNTVWALWWIPPFASAEKELVDVYATRELAEQVMKETSERVQPAGSTIFAMLEVQELVVVDAQTHERNKRILNNDK